MITIRGIAALLFVATLLALLLAVVTEGCNEQPEQKRPPQREKIV